MSDLQTYLALGTFVAVVLVIALDLIDMVVTALLGVCIMIAFGILTERELVDAIHIAGGPLALLFGGMVVARVLAKTGLFDVVEGRILRATRGSGKRFLLLLVVLVSPVCAFLPNATTVILLAPIIIRVARALDVDFVGPLVLTAIISNSAGMLTLVGDPATFLVGSSIGLGFYEYLQRVSLGGLLAVGVVVPFLPRLVPDVWNARSVERARGLSGRIERPGFAALALGALLLMVSLFLLGDRLPIPLVPPAVAIIAATFALLVVYGERVEPIDNVFRDIDWKTLVFLGAIFCLVQGIGRTGLLQGLSFMLYSRLGVNFTVVALVLLAAVGLLSALLANIPVVAASLIMVKGYLVATQAVPEVALAAGFGEWPVVTLPVFIALMFGATLGGNATLIGASANIVSVGICAQHGERVTFMRFLRYGLPITAAQLLVSALYVLWISWWARGSS